MNDFYCEHNEDGEPPCYGLEKLRQRLREHEQFRQQHRDCDAMALELQGLKLRVKALKLRVEELEGKL
jgi:hypothetical protein